MKKRIWKYIIRTWDDVDVYAPAHPRMKILPPVFGMC